MMLQLRYASLSQGGTEVPVLVICAHSRNEVLEIANIVLVYYETPGPKEHPDVSFHSTPDGGLSFSYRLPGAGDVLIEGVDGEIGRKLTSALRKTREFIILLAYGEPIKFVSPKTFSMVRSTIQIDDRIYSGASARVDVSELLAEIEGLVSNPHTDAG